MKTFLQAYLDKDINAEAIDDYIDKWDSDNSIEEPLHEYLGMTYEQFSAYVMRDELPQR
jgi:hypothetical protein